MQVFTETVDSYLGRGFRGTQFMVGGKDSEIIYRASKGDSEAKLKLVKGHLDLIVGIAAEYSAKTGKSFFQMIQAGISALIRTAEKSHDHHHIDFVERAQEEIIKAMKEIL